jgi:hypothetical protein
MGRSEKKEVEMNRWHRHIIRIAALLAATAVLVPAAQAGGNSGDVGLARGILQTQFGFSPSRAADWTTGVCSYGDNPSSCYLSDQQAAAQSKAEAQAMGVQPIPVSTPAVTATVTTGFQWGDAGIGAAATLGLVLILASLGGLVLRNRRRPLIHA